MVITHSFLKKNMQQRSILMFENSIKSEHTRKTYIYHLNKFMKYFEIDDYDSLAAIGSERMQIMMEDYVMDLKKTLTASSLRVKIAAISTFLECNDIELRWKKIKRLMPAASKKTGGEAWTTEDIKTMLSFTTDHRTKALVHFLASTGVRIGALETLRMGNLTDIEDCKSVLIYEGSPEEYLTFLTPEASQVVDNYIQKRKSDGEIIGLNSPVFRSSYQLASTKSKFAASRSLMEIMLRLVNKSQLRDMQFKIGRRYNKQSDHAFRKRFNVILKTTPNMNISLAEKMMGHSVTVVLDNSYLPINDQTVRDKMFVEFKKAIPELTIDDTARKQAVIEQKEKENSELKIVIDEKDQALLRLSKIEAYIERDKLRAQKIQNQTSPII